MEKRGWTAAWFRSALLLVLPIAAVACSDPRPDEFPMPFGGDGGLPPRVVKDVAAIDTPGDGGTDGPRDGGMGDGGDASPDVQPVRMEVTILSPLKGAAIAARSNFIPSVRVTVASPMPSASDVVTEVTATLIRRTTQMRVLSAKLNQTGVQTLPESSTIEYQFAESAVDLTKVESAEYDLVVVAATVGGAKGEASISLRIDAGPTIRIIDPAEGKSEQLSTKVRISIKDTLFPTLKSTSFFVGQWPITTLQRTGDEWTGVIEFAKFDPPLDGEQLLTVRATNSNDVEAMAIRKFVVDKTGPLIANTGPKVGALIGKIITIQADVSDPSGVIDSSVVAVIAHGDNNFEVKLDPPPAGSTTPTYKKLFDTTRLPNKALFPSISFRARDVHGNESSVGYLVSLDNTPPLADLDPPDDFRTLFKVEDSLRCSWPFDPVGPDAVDDGDKVPQLFDIRARIEDQGNEALSGTPDFTPIAGVDETRAQLLILDDIQQPLVVDNNGDGVCDEVNPNLTPTTAPKSSQDALLINMVPIPPAGVPDGTVEAGSSCSGGVLLRPDPPCTTTANAAKSRWPREPIYMGAVLPWVSHSDVMLKYIGYTTGRMAAIWTVPPVVDDKVQCAGRQFDAFANNLTDGWACVAVAAADKLGNLQVSRALRLCIDRDGDGNPCPHKPLASISGGTSFTLETKVAHGLMQDEEVIVSGVTTQTAANGRWRVNVVDATHFSLVGAQPYQPHFCHDLDRDAKLACDPRVGVSSGNRIVSMAQDAAGIVVETAQPHGMEAFFAGVAIPPEQRVIMTGLVDQPHLNGTHEFDWVGPGPSNKFLLKGAVLVARPADGRVVAVREIPDCTGTMTAKPMGTTPAVVTKEKACRAWKSYPRGEYRAD